MILWGVVRIPKERKMKEQKNIEKNMKIGVNLNLIIYNFTTDFCVVKLGLIRYRFDNRSVNASILNYYII